MADLSVNDYIRAIFRRFVGTWAYQHGVGALSLSMTGRKYVHAIVAWTDGTTGTLQINGGDLITIPADGEVTLQPGGMLVSPDIEITGDNTSYLIQWLA